MTGRADFTQEEWELVLEGPPNADERRKVTPNRGFRIAASAVEGQHGTSRVSDAGVGSGTRSPPGARPGAQGANQEAGEA
jgi:hypothetical protein